jgi:tRNA nucleotidyltransferase (CCA-adding enzyme)
MSNETVINKILNHVLKEIKPSDKEYKDTILKINLIISSLKEIVPKDVEIKVTGSVSRGTNLKGNSDIDIFLLFKTGTTKDYLEKMGLKYGKALVKNKSDSYSIKYAEHPYVRVFLKSLNIKADIVPALKIENAEQLATAVDRTPLHTIFINEKLNEKQKDQVRLLKYFLKNHSLYGAETKTSGFSGYLCEVLIYHFGTFLNVLRWSSNLSNNVVILLNNKEDDKATLSENELIKKFNSEFIVVDPIDKNRNVAAVLSKESISRFIVVSRKFLEAPSLDYFYGLKYSNAKLKNYLKTFIEKSGLDIFSLTVNLPDKSEEILWPQLKKSSTIIEEHLKKNEFDIYLSLQFISDKKGVIVLLAPKQEKRTRMFKGPGVINKKGTEQFMSSHSKTLGFTFLDSRIYSLDYVYYKNISEALSSIKKNRQLYFHKDINLSNIKISKNKFSSKITNEIAYELMKKFYI